MSDLDIHALTKTPYADPLTGVAILEKDSNYDVLWTWMYPGLPDKFKTVLRSRSQLTERTPPKFELSSLDSVYCYSTTRSGDEITVAAPAREAVAARTAAREAGDDEFELDDELQAVLDDENRVSALDKVTGFSVVILATEFFPEKYEALGAVLANVYAATGLTSNVLQAYFKALLKAKVDAGPLGAYIAADIDIRNSWLSASIKDVIITFGADVVLVWGAMLLNKRILVYSDTRDALEPVLRALPLFVWHKKDWSLLIPYSQSSDVELAELASKPTYAAGITSPALLSSDHLYDVVLNVSDRSVSVAPHASADLAIGSFVKDLATYLVDAGNDPDMTDGDIIKGLAVKTGELIKKVRSLAVDRDSSSPAITRDSLADAGIQGALANFLYNVAAAEGIAQ
ncbi:uncharacterized protein AMSG_12271 [Thecamonas trahens ATCC 50062]|uniref:UDENN domain-containing protein n=1 Tax=Thecamonas trahens ATCC 50062 TaxID=461836 RepID=A0A0L0DQV2_THETB|nr:hypothetical protein AMSG_12271 [Thecamonas trahens ATCC 50062]KNC53813.1 hypothetical protein AMSG_12271 [Thecamonas trahens ATCC 50062]|eukprot:XP_013754384.1 hypothetical protein AMSG_12271 [Thecamonas trahens ATCC 50062]